MTTKNKMKASTKNAQSRGKPRLLESQGRQLTHRQAELGRRLANLKGK